MNVIQTNLCEYGLADTLELKQEIFNLRELVFSDKQHYLLNKGSDTPGADKFDACSYLFYAKYEDHVIGSCRLTPLINRECELSNILPEHILNLDPEKFIYFSRVAIHPDFRNNHVHELLFYHFSKWLLAHTNFETFFSLCHPPLLKLYNKFNIYKSNTEILRIESRENREYLIIEGNIRSTYNRICELLNT